MLSPRFALAAVIVLVGCTTKTARRPDTTAPAAATLAGSPAVDIATIRKAIAALDSSQGAALIKGDIAAATAYYADDAIVMVPNDKIAIGHDAVAKAMSTFLDQTKVLAFTPHSQDVLVTGDYAIETLTYEMTLQPKKGKPFKDVGKGLTVFKKQPDGSYKAVRDIFNSDGPAK